MKKFLTIVAALFVSASVFAQTTNDSHLIKVDVGYGSAVGGIPVGVSYEKGILEFSDGAFVTVGGYIGYDSKKESYYYYDWKKSQIAIMAQANYYLKPIVDKLDLYAGLRLGYTSISSKYIYNGKGYYSDGYEWEYSWGSPFGYDVHVGANYWFSDMFGVNAEFGYGIAYLNVGLAVKF